MKRKIKILFKENETYQLPILITQTNNNLGVMSYFDGDIEIIEKSNFTYSGNGMTIIVYNSVNTIKNKEYADALFKINWGDGNSDTLEMLKITDTELPNVSHTYMFNNEFNIEVIIESPWGINKITKKIKIPFKTEYPIKLGELTFNVPYNEDVTHTQQYNLNYLELTGKTPANKINFIGFGKSRINELKKYGVNEYNNIYLGDGQTGYTINGLYYIDFDDGMTQIIGSTSGTTENFFTNSEEYNGMLTRNEHFIGFIDEPQLFSDVLIDRGRLSVMENNFKLLEVDNMGELVVYGNKFFKIKKQ